MIWKLRSLSLDLGAPLIMGILNVTPDSFSDGGEFTAAADAVGRGFEMVEAGAAVVDVGGESTRPGAATVDDDLELRRILPVIERLVGGGVVVSVDTRKPQVARVAVAAGAEIINDVSGLADPAMRELAAQSGAGVVIMHMRGEPETMQDGPVYADVVGEVTAFLAERVDWAIAAGIDRNSICIDPGIGFGKTVVHNLEILANLDQIAALRLPILLGTSRKRFLGEVLGIDDPKARDQATAVTVALGVAGGARVFRVHDVVPNAEAARLAWAIVSSRSKSDEKS